MAWQSTPFTAPLFATGVFSLLLAGYVGLYASRHGWDRMLIALVGLLVFAGVWTIADAFQVASVTLKSKQVWRDLAVVGAEGVAISWLALVLTYTNREDWVTPQRFGPVLAFGVGTITFDVLNPWSSIQSSATLVDNGSFLVLTTIRTPLGRAIEFVYILIIVLSIYLLVRLLLGPQELYRWQAVALAVAAVFPTSAHVASILDLSPYPTVNLASMGFAGSGIVLTYATIRYRLFDLTPAVRDTVIETMEEGYVVLDDRRRVLDLNPAARRLLGAPPDPLGQPIEALFGTDEPMLPEEDPSDTRVLTLETDEESRYVSIRTSVLDSDRATKLLLFQDVTERLRVEQRYQALIEYASDVTAILDQSGQVEYISPAIERHLGYAPGDVEGNQIFDIILPADRDLAQNALERIIKDPGRSTQVECRVTDTDESVRVFEAVIRNLTHEPAVDGFVLNAWDVTERNDRVRTLEMLNRLLRHDIRNDLQVVELTTQLLADHVDEAGQQHLDRVSSRVEHAVELTDTVRDLIDSLDDGQGAIEPIPLQPVLDAELEDARQMMTDGSITVADSIPAVAVLADDMLSSVFRNLLRNSILHHDREAPTVSVSVEHSAGRQATRQSEDALADMNPSDQSPTRETVTVRIADDGPGIPDDRKDEVFGRGVQGLESEGTGIGLYLVRTLVEGYGGEIWIEDNEPRGTVFVIVLRVARDY